MSDLGNREVFAENLQRYMLEHGKDRTTISKDLGIAYTTLTEWCKGTAYPRIDKIELLANYFGILKSDLVEKKGEDSYYNDPETLKVAQKLKDNKELSLLFDAAQDADPEDLLAVHSILLRLKGKGSD